MMSSVENFLNRNYPRFVSTTATTTANVCSEFTDNYNVGPLLYILGNLLAIAKATPWSPVYSSLVSINFVISQHSLHEFRTCAAFLTFG